MQLYKVSEFRGMGTFSQIRTDLRRAASWFAWVVRPVEGSTTGAPGSAGLLCKFLVYADQDLKKLDVLKQGMAHWNGLSS